MPDTSVRGTYMERQAPAARPSPARSAAGSRRRKKELRALGPQPALLPLFTKRPIPPARNLLKQQAHHAVDGAVTGTRALPGGLLPAAPLFQLPPAPASHPSPHSSRWQPLPTELADRSEPDQLPAFVVERLPYRANLISRQAVQTIAVVVRHHVVVADPHRHVGCPGIEDHR
jgi:hypothetical protein